LLHFRIGDIETFDESENLEKNKTSGTKNETSFKKAFDIENNDEDFGKNPFDIENNDEDFGLWVGSITEDLISNKFFHYLNQFKALFIKKCIHSIRNIALVLSQLLIPAVFLVLNLAFIKFGTIPDGDMPSLSISISKYDQNYMPYNIINEDNSIKNNQTLDTISKYFLNQFENQNIPLVFNINNSTSIPISKFCSIKKCDTTENYLSEVGNYSDNILNNQHFSAFDFLIKNSSQNIEITGHFNNQPFHIAPLTLNLITNTLFKYYTNSSSSSINLINHPLPRDELDRLKKASGFGFKPLFISMGFNFGFSFLIASFAMFLIKERASGSKHLQYLNGCNSYIFWISAFVWDFLSYIIPVVLAIVILLVQFKNLYFF